MTLFATALTLTQRGAIDQARLTVQLDLLRAIMPQAQLTSICARSSADALAESALTQLSIKPDVGSGAPSIRVSRVQRAELVITLTTSTTYSLSQVLPHKCLLRHTPFQAQNSIMQQDYSTLIQSRVILCQETSGKPVSAQ